MPIIILVLQSRKLVMVKNFITAAEAQKLTETSEKYINVLYKAIREAAEYGLCETTFGVSQMSEISLRRIKISLEGAGYKFFEITEDLEGVPSVVALRICW